MIVKTENVLVLRMCSVLAQKIHIQSWIFFGCNIKLHNHDLRTFGELLILKLLPPENLKMTKNNSNLPKTLPTLPLLKYIALNSAGGEGGNQPVKRKPGWQARERIATQEKKRRQRVRRAPSTAQGHEIFGGITTLPFGMALGMTVPLSSSLGLLGGSRRYLFGP